MNVNRVYAGGQRFPLKVEALSIGCQLVGCAILGESDDLVGVTGHAAWRP